MENWMIPFWEEKGRSASLSCKCWFLSVFSSKDSIYQSGVFWAGWCWTPSSFRHPCIINSHYKGVQGAVSPENVSHNLLRLIDSREMSLSWTWPDFLVSGGLEQSRAAPWCLVFVRKTRVLSVESQAGASSSWDLWPQNRPTSRFL